MTDTLGIILESGLVAVIRSDHPEGLVEAAKALSDGGVKALEVTLNTPGALDAISTLAAVGKRNFVVGAGSVLDGESARVAILAGAEFLVAPNLNTRAIEVTKRYGKVICSGAFTPTEIVNAQQAGADIIKIFPASSVGPKYIKDILAPLSQVRVMPVGGVNLKNIADYLQAGACAVGVGSSLVNSKLIAQGDWLGITELARQHVRVIESARSSCAQPKGLGPDIPA